MPVSMHLRAPQGVVQRALPGSSYSILTSRCVTVALTSRRRRTHAWRRLALCLGARREATWAHTSSMRRSAHAGGTAWVESGRTDNTDPGGMELSRESAINNGWYNKLEVCAREPSQVSCAQQCTYRTAFHTFYALCARTAPLVRRLTPSSLNPPFWVFLFFQGIHCMSARRDVGGVRGVGPT